MSFSTNSKENNENQKLTGRIGGYDIAELSAGYKDISKLNFRFKQAIYAATEEVGAKTNGEWLDYGCGWGVFLYHLALQLPGWKFRGVDADEDSLKIQKKVFSVSNVSADKQPNNYYMSLPENSYDVVSFMEVVEHVENPGEVLRAFRKSLRQDGLLIITTPNALGWNYLSIEIRRLVNRILGRRGDDEYLKLMKARPYNPVTEEGHVLQFSVETLERLLRVCGFEMVSFMHTHQDSSLLSKLFKDNMMVIARKV